MLRNVFQRTSLFVKRNLSTAPTPTKPQVIQGPDGRTFLAFDTRRIKLKPRIVRNRLSQMKTYEGHEKNIKYSPRRMNLLCQLVRKLPISEALLQLQFNKKSKAPLLSKVLQRTANLADIRNNLPLSSLEVAECIATPATSLKRMKIMGRGRAGKMTRKHTHVRVVLREIDFPLKIVQAPTINQKKKWYLLQQKAKKDREQAMQETQELQELQGKL